jgi:hypothetical protein
LKHESPIDTIDLDFALSAIDLYRSSICLQDKIQDNTHDTELNYQILTLSQKYIKESGQLCY